MTKCILNGGQLCTSDGLLTNHALVIDQQRITAIIPAHLISNHLPAQIIQLQPNHWISRGWLDLHIHGALGFDVMDATVNSIEKIAVALAQLGITGFLATTMTSNENQLLQVIEAVLHYQKNPHPQGAICLGLHLEGPFIASEQMGAQLQSHITSPDAKQFLKWQEAAHFQIKRITLAPELPNAIELIQAAKSTGCAVSIGHTHATFAQTQTAITAGCTQATHLFNAMRGFHHREPGAVGALLLANEIDAELIVDPWHLHPASVELAYRLKGLRRLCLVSDAMRATCLGDGEFELGGQMVQVHQGKATLANGQLAGSTLRLADAVLAFSRHTGISLFETLQLVTLNPARWLNQEDHLGKLEAEQSADITIMDNEGNIVLTMHQGKILFVTDQIKLI